MSWKDQFPKENRYFETENGILYCGDSVELLKKFPDKSVDLILTDPPYGILKGKDSIGGKKPISGSKIYEANKYNCEWDIKPSKEVFDEMFRVSENQIICGYNYFTDILGNTNSLIIWDKKERNSWFDNFSDGEIIWSSYKKPLRIFRHLWTGALRKERDTLRVHPTQKPVRLFKWILKDYLKDNVVDLVLDPFIGSGTTAVACEKLNKKWIGIEISTEYCEIAKRRISEFAKNKRLFEYIKPIGGENRGRR